MAVIAALKPRAGVRFCRFQGIGGGGAETLGRRRRGAISSAYFSVITLAFCRFLLRDVITAAASWLYWQAEAEKMH